MDLQKLIDTLSAHGSAVRGSYHVTLGELTGLCEANPDGVVIVNSEGGLGRENSYRGYYCDLAFAPAEKPTPTSDVLACCKRAATCTYEGYKGGDYNYHSRTPLWLASYGNSGPAIVSALVIGGDIHLTTKDTPDA